MRTLFIATLFLFVTACVQDEGKIDSGSVSDDSGSTTGTTSGGSTGGSSGNVDDPLYGLQWHLFNDGQDVKSYVNLTLGIDTTPLAGNDINVTNVHDNEIYGTGVKVVVSDTGTDYSHPDLDGNFIAGMRNYSHVDPTRWDDASADAYPSGNENHGTAVAGIIAMEGWNGIGGRGVAPAASISAFKFLLGYSALDHLASDQDKLIHQLSGDFDIFNYSYGYGQCVFYEDYESDLIDALKDGVATLRGGKGAIYVQSAGNSFSEGGGCYGNTNATASLSVPYKIVTAAVSADGVKSSYSTPGSGVWVSGYGGEGMVDLGIPSGIRYLPAIYTTDIGDCSSGYSYRNFIYKLKNPFNYGYDRDLNPLCDYTNIMNGTSSAAPIVSGVVALMLEVNPDLDWREVKHILAMTARKDDFVDPAPATVYGPLSHPDTVSTFGAYVYDYKWVQNFAGHWFSNWYGFGTVDADAAVTMAAGFPAGSLGTYTRTESALGVWTHTDSTLVGINDNDVVTPAASTIAGVTSLIIEAVQIRLTTDHPNPEELAVHVISPSGTESRVVLAKSGIEKFGSSDDYYFLTNAFYGEDSGGIWTINVYDTVTGNTGSMQGWGVNIHGHP